MARALKEVVTQATPDDFMRRYRPVFITIWHVDPERPNTGNRRMIAAAGLIAPGAIFRRR